MEILQVLALAIMLFSCIASLLPPQMSVQMIMPTEKTIGSQKIGGGISKISFRRTSLRQTLVVLHAIKESMVCRITILAPNARGSPGIREFENQGNFIRQSLCIKSVRIEHYYR